MNAESGIRPSAHHPALFFIHSGIPSVCDSLCFAFETTIIPSLIKYSIPSMNAESGIWPSAHHPALFLTHSGTDDDFVSVCPPTTNANSVCCPLPEIFENLAIVRPVCSSVNVKSVKSAPIFANLSSEKIVLPSCNIVNV